MSPYPTSPLPAPRSFAPGVAEQIGSYVYLLIDPRKNAVFYVGKGTGNRCFAHLAEARNTLVDAIGDYAKLARIREIEAAGKAVRIDLLRHGLSEREAFLIESAAIDLLGVGCTTNRVAGFKAAERGRMAVSEINALYAAPVEIDPSHRVVLITINRTFEQDMTDAALYEATRKWWPVAAMRRQIGESTAPQWAMATYRGIVRAVYKIDTWEQPPENYLSDHPEDAHRWGFRGIRDLSMESIYLYRDVSSYLTSQFPLRYVNCTKDWEESVG